MILFRVFKQNVLTTILSKFYSFKQMLILLLIYITVFVRNKISTSVKSVFLNPDFSFYFLFLPTYASFQILLQLILLSKLLKNKVFHMRNIHSCHVIRIGDY